VPFPTQDLMMIENQWGAIAKREREHLVASDREIIGIRRRLLKMVKNLADGIEPEEPFLMKGIRQENPENPVMIPKAARLNADGMDKLAAGLNTTRAIKASSEDEVMWAPSVEADSSIREEQSEEQKA
jgi:hypothetical protein